MHTVFKQRRSAKAEKAKAQAALENSHREKETVKAIVGLTRKYSSTLSASRAENHYAERIRLAFESEPRNPPPINLFTVFRRGKS